MGMIAGTNYDPGTEATKSLTSLLAMTAFDTTNLRLTFTVPSNGIVLVRIRCFQRGASTPATILLGVLESSTVKGRIAPIGRICGNEASPAAGSPIVQEALFTVSGLTPGASLTWDAAYGVEIVSSAGGVIAYGGPNDTTLANAEGGISFEIWSATNCLGSIMYDPTSSVSKSTTALLAMTAIDTTNLRITFTAPASGNVLVRLRTLVHGASTYPQIMLGILDGSTVKARVTPLGGSRVGNVATAQLSQEAMFCITGLTPGQSYTWDAAYAVDITVASTGLKYGGPNNTTTNDAFGAFLYEIWSV